MQNTLLHDVWTRAATNDYFVNRLVGRLFFPNNLIKKRNFLFYFCFIDKKHFLPNKHSAQCPSNKCQLNAMKTVLNNLLDHLS